MPAEDADAVPNDPLLDELRASLRRANDLYPLRTQALLRLGEDMVRADASPGSPSRETLERLGDRWSPLLLIVLSTGHYRHAELRRVITALTRLSSDSTITQRMLTLRLRVLERDGLVERTVGTGKVPSVEYRLTPLGDSLSAHLNELMSWCAAHGDRMRAAQQAFDERAEAPSPGRHGAATSRGNGRP